MSKGGNYMRVIASIKIIFEEMKKFQIITERQ
jgi:hypothetical protein